MFLYTVAGSAKHNKRKLLCVKWNNNSGIILCEYVGVCVCVCVCVWSEQTGLDFMNSLLLFDVGIVLYCTIPRCCGFHTSFWLATVTIVIKLLLMMSAEFGIVFLVLRYFPGHYCDIHVTRNKRRSRILPVLGRAFYTLEKIRNFVTDG